MRNCLVTKLKESVQNDSLCRLGFTRIKIDDKDKYDVISIGSGNIAAPYDKVYLEGGKVFTDTGTSEHDWVGLSKEVMPAGPFVLQVPKYYISVFALTLVNGDTTTISDAFNIEELQYTDRCRQLNLVYNNGVYGDLSKLSNLVLGKDNGSSELNLYKTSVTGTLSDILNMYDPTALAAKNLTINVGVTAITGNAKTMFDTWAATAGQGNVCSLFWGYNNTNIDYSELTPTPGVENPVRCKATAAGDGTYTYVFS